MLRFTILTFLCTVGVSFSHSISQNYSNEDLNAIIKYRNNSVNPCIDPLRYPLSCVDVKLEHKGRYMEKLFIGTRALMINDLQQLPSKDEVRALSIEKNLFQACLKLGSKESAESKLKSNDYFFNQVLREVDSNPYWLFRELALYDKGLGFNFFDVTLERDRENPDKNIITLSPPSFLKIKSTAALVTDALDNISFKKPEEANYRAVYDLPVEEKESIKGFFKEWLKLFSSNPVVNEDPEILRVSLINWQHMNEEYAKTSNIADANTNWDYFITRLFGKNNVPLSPVQQILIKDSNYFLQLNDLFSFYSKDIKNVLKVKLLTENLRYLDWKKGEFLEHTKRSNFCFEDTKLYGASFKFVKDVIEELQSRIPNFKLVDDILNNIAEVTISDLDRSNFKSHVLEYLKAEIKSITTSALDYQQYENVVTLYYDGYEFRNSYFIDIITYKKLIKDKELRSLNDNLSKYPVSVPFSINDLDKPRNKFVLSSVKLISSLSLKKLPKEVYYGTYGAKMASMLVGILSEHKDRKSKKSTENHRRSNWLPQVKYKNNILQCIDSENYLNPTNKPSAIAAVKEILGLRIAFKALVKDYFTNNVQRDTDFGNEGNFITADQLFFLSYMQTNCFLDHNWTKTLFQNLIEFQVSYQCYNPKEYRPSDCILSIGDVIYNPFAPLNKPRATL